MFRFNKNAALAGKKVVNGLGETIHLQKEAPGWPFPLSDNYLRFYTDNGKVKPGTDDPLDLYMAEETSEENKTKDSPSKPKEPESNLEEKKEESPSTYLKKGN